MPEIKLVVFGPLTLLKLKVILAGLYDDEKVVIFEIWIIFGSIYTTAYVFIEEEFICKLEIDDIEIRDGRVIIIVSFAANTFVV